MSITKIEILGMGCSKCQKLEQVVRETVEEIGISASIVKINKVEDIMKYKVMITPALVINGEVKVAGKIPSKEDIKNWLSKI